MPSLRSLRGPSFAPLVLVVAACLLSSTIALAAPATVTASYADAHSAPFKSTPVVHTFKAGDKLSADEQARDGWRRVRLPDGGLGFVREDELKVEAAQPAAAPKPAPPPFVTVPAKVKVFELTVRAAPSNTAAVLQTLAEGAAVAVSEDEKDGFRRTLLADGRTAFVAAGGLEIGVVASTVGEAAPIAPAAPTAPVQPIGGAAATVEKKPQIYVKDLDHLAELVRADSVVHPMAEALVTRENAVYVVGGVSLVGGTLLSILALTALAKDSCTEPVFAGDAPFCTKDPNMTLVGVGMGTLVVGGLIALIVAPKRNDFLDVINAWNTRHTDSQFSIESHEVGQH